jgi:hypothetical protein
MWMEIALATCSSILGWIVFLIEVQKRENK